MKVIRAEKFQRTPEQILEELCMQNRKDSKETQEKKKKSCSRRLYTFAQNANYYTEGTPLPDKTGYFQEGGQDKDSLLRRLQSSYPGLLVQIVEGGVINSMGDELPSHTEDHEVRVSVWVALPSREN